MMAVGTQMSGSLPKWLEVDLGACDIQVPQLSIDVPNICLLAEHYLLNYLEC